MGTAVVRGSDGTEALLTGCVPLSAVSNCRFFRCYRNTYNLQLDGLAIEFDSPDFLSCVSLRQAEAQHAVGVRTKSTPMVEM